MKRKPFPRAWLFAAPILLIFAYTGVVWTGQNQNPITPAELAQRLNDHPEEIFLLDVRTREEHQAARIPGTDARIDYREIETHPEPLPKDKSTPIVVYCRTGHRSGIAYGVLKKMGYRNLYNLEGGITRWIQEGRPVESDRSPSRESLLLPARSPLFDLG